MIKEIIKVLSCIVFPLTGYLLSSLDGIMFKKILILSLVIAIYIIGFVLGLCYN